MKKHYPKFLSSLLIIFSMIATTTILGGLAEALLGEEKSILLSFAILTFNTIIVFVVAYLFVRRHYKPVFKGMYSKEINFRFLYTIIPIIIGTMMLNAVINNFMPTQQDGIYINFMTKLASNKWYITLFLIPIVFIAPITEELVYRGMILRGLSGHYSSKLAILISAMFFSLMHLNFAQIPNAFILGVIFAILMIHSKNIIYVILYHMLNNFLVTFMLYFIDPESLKNTEVIKEILPPEALASLLTFGIVLIYAGLRWTIKIITNKEKNVLPSDEIFNDYLKGFDK